MVFADDERESNPTSFKFLQMAHEWAKRSKTGAAPSSLFAGFGPASTQAAPSKPEPEAKADSESDVASSDEE